MTSSVGSSSREEEKGNDSVVSRDGTERGESNDSPTQPKPEATSTPKAWLQVVCGFFIFMSSWGFLNTFGVFQPYYRTTLLPNTSDSDLSWIGSIAAFLLCFGSMLTGPLFDIGFVKPMIFAGTFLIVFGMMMTSLCKEYWQFVLAQGVCVGIGSGPLFISSVAVIPGYSTRNRALAIGIAASGSSMGGIVYPIIFHYLVPKIGFGWTTRVIGFIALGTLVISCFFLTPKVSPDPSKRRNIVDLSGFRELPFNLFCAAAFTGFCGLYIPFFYITAYATRLGLAPTLAFYMLPILSAGSTPADGFQG